MPHFFVLEIQRTVGRAQRARQLLAAIHEAAVHNARGSDVEAHFHPHAAQRWLREIPIVPEFH